MNALNNARNGHLECRRRCIDLEARQRSSVFFVGCRGAAFGALAATRRTNLRERWRRDRDCGGVCVRECGRNEECSC